MIIILLLFLIQGLNAQFYEYGQDAGSLCWLQYRTPHYQVIFPRGVEEVALNFARRLEAYYPYLGSNLDHQHQKVPVIVHNESSYSNGVSVWAPRRLEIYSNPDPNGYNQDWLSQLAVHEGRHVVQIDKLYQGFTRVLYYVGGEQFVGAMAVFLPYWYLEGDAVDTETRLSEGGRGRLPSFGMGLKAQMLEGGDIYSFDKATMGSYRNFIPNHYELGYLMVRYGRRTYGDQFWIDFQDAAARKPYLLNPTWFSMRSYGLKSKSKFYKNALGYYRNYWAALDSLRSFTVVEELSPDKGNNFTQYRHAHPMIDGSVIACKSGIDQIPAFVRIEPGGKENTLFNPGYLSSGRITVSERYIVWDELVPDIRWSHRNFSVIRKYDLVDGEVSNLGHRTRYYAPAISNEGKRIVAVEQNVSQKYKLVVMDMKGNILEEHPSPGNVFIQHPSWMDGDSSILMVASRGVEKMLLSVDLESGRWDEIYRAGPEDISFPIQHGDSIFFSGTFSGIDNIYCLHTVTGACQQVSSSRFGARDAALTPNGQSLIYSDYSRLGYRLVQLSMEDADWSVLGRVKGHDDQLDYGPSPEEETMTDSIHAEISGEQSMSFEIKPYRKLPNLFNVHSWLPLYFDYLDPSLELRAEELPVSPGISLVSQNHLGTAISQVGYEYKNGFHYFHSGIKLKGRVPVLNLSLDYGGEPDVLIYHDEADTAMSLPRDLRFSARTYVPLRLNTGKFLSLVQPSVDYQYNRDLQYIEESDLYRSGTHFLRYSFYATSYLRKGMRDIWPRLGFALNTGYFHAPFDSRVYGAVSYGSLYAYIPGLFKHQSVRLSLHRQVQDVLDESRPAYVNLISLPRGLHGIFAEEMTRYTADYVFPILYPDLGTLVYLKRIRAQVWADYMVGKNVILRDPDPHLDDHNYGSAGLDLWLDLHLLRIPFPISIGMRIGYENNTNRPFMDLLYTIDFN